MPITPTGLAENAPDVAVDLAQVQQIQGSQIANADLAPVPASQRKWGLWSVAALWISMSTSANQVRRTKKQLKAVPGQRRPVV